GERDRPGLRRSSDVAVVEAADVGQDNHAAELGWLDGARLGCILLEREMRPRAVVVAKVYERAFDASPAEQVLRDMKPLSRLSGRERAIIGGDHRRIADHRLTKIRVLA